MRAIPVALLLALLAVRPAPAQTRPPADGGVIGSLGQPDPWKWDLGLATGWLFQKGNGRAFAEARIGVYHDLVNPVTGVGGYQLESYLGIRQTALDPGLRARLVSPFLRLGVGLDYSYQDGLDLILSFTHPTRRAGLFHDGTAVRLDYIPGRNHALTLGIETPAFRRIPMGRTRPLRDHVVIARDPVPAAPAPANVLALDSLLAELRASADWIRQATVLFMDYGGRHARESDTLLVRGLRAFERKGYEAEVRRYHALLEQAFTVAVAGPGSPGADATAAARRITAQARTVLLDEVLLPYNRLLGQTKKTDSVRGFGRHARGIFARWLLLEVQLPQERATTVSWLFAWLVDLFDANRAAAHAQWGDSRMVWLPLQYALLPEQHDSQAELDALVARATQDTFTEGNFVSYAISEQFQYQLSRTIRQAEDYHVLWTHDVRGLDDSKQPDEMAFRQVVRSYLAALTARARDYDRTGKFPVYIILLDEWFYQINRGRLWMDLLEDPTRHVVKLPRGYEAWQDTIAKAQQELRAAIAGSALLQAHRREYGERWLRNLVRVQVNITNPADPSFWSNGLIDLLPLPDNMMRDHRKIAFYDLTEDDPYKGEAMYTGAGVAEHYASLSWEDRTLLVKGPAVLSLKRGAWQMLRDQGMTPEQIPYPLHPREKPADYDARILRTVQGGQRPLRALGMHNAPGFGDKQVNVAKAVLYTLMPEGSVIKIPDSLWNSAFWSAALMGAALRGCRVLIIAPSRANSPVPYAAPASRSQQMLSRLLTTSNLLERQIEEAGGLLRIGIWAPQFQVTDIPAKVKAVEVTFAREAWLRDLFGFPSSVYQELAEVSRTVEGLAMKASAVAPEFEYDPQPKLHLKANFFASREAWSIMARPEWASITWEFVLKRIAQVQTRPAAVRSFEETPEVFIDVGSAMVEDWFNGLDPAARERAIFYLFMGSHNQNYRSMIVDGEVGFLLSNWPSIIPYLDFISMVGQSRWITTQQELEALLPAETGLMWRIARWLKLTL